MDGASPANGVDDRLSEESRADLALRASEERYRTLFNTMGQGYALVELVRDASGKAIDQRYLAFNPAIERLLGVSAADTIGKLASEVFPGIEPWWTETFDRVVAKGSSERIEHFFSPLGRWYEVYAYPAGGDKFVTLYEDTTERKRAEAALRESEKRQAFLLKFSDVLRAEPNAEAMANRALQMLFDEMRLDRCYVGVYQLEMDLAQFPYQVHDDRLPPVPSQVRLSDFPEALRVAFDRTLVVDDSVEMNGFSDSDRASFDGLGLRAVIAATLRKGANNPLWAIVAGSSRPRFWTESEVSLVEEVAERTWAAVERSRAEAAFRESEDRFRRFSNASTNVLWIRDAASLQMEFASPAFDTIYGFPDPDRGGDPSVRCWAKLIEPHDRKVVLDNFRRVRAGERVEVEFQIRRASDGALRWIYDTEFPLYDAAGNVAWVAGHGADITDTKEAADRQHVLVAELQHRTRNLLGIIRSLSDKTARSSANLDDFHERFRTRLDALARVQGLLSRLDHGRVTFDELVDAELAVLNTVHQVSIDGIKGIRLRSSMVQTLAMAIHELATNAVKYGALGQANGHLAISWKLDQTDPAEPRLLIDWRESGVTMRQSAARPGGGHGRQLIERALPYQLGASTSYKLEPDGVHCTISVPAVSLSQLRVVHA